MSRPPLYSRTGNTISPTAMSSLGANIAAIDPSGSIHEAISTSIARTAVENEDLKVDHRPRNTESSLLDGARQFSTLAVNHVEEVRHALLLPVADDSVEDEDGNADNIARAFQELSAAYDRLSSLKWDAARREFEGNVRRRARSKGAERKCQNTAPDISAEDMVKKQSKTSNETTKTKDRVVAKKPGKVKDHPWQDDVDNEQADDMEPTNWISDAFLKAAISEEDDDIVNGAGSGHLAAMNATTEPNNPPKLTPFTPPGFKLEPIIPDRKAGAPESKNDASKDEQGDAADDSAAIVKPFQSMASYSSEISSLHTTSHPGTDDDEDDDDSDSEYSDTTSSSSSSSSSSTLIEDLPPQSNFDYVYNGGYAMRVSSGKETKGVVPKTVKRVLVDPSVRMIEEGAFQGCGRLESIVVPSSVRVVGDHAFRKCSRLRSVRFLTRATNTTLRRDGKLHGSSDHRKNGDEKKEEKPSPALFADTTTHRSSRLRSIGEWAFFGCSSLTTMELPHGLESIGTRAFQRCSSMMIVSELPGTLTSVGECAFVGCPRETKAAYERWERDRIG
mmetsp:Transcript_12734/g.31084  ORF Transcript_12734/g.31084 Transcript_12734/m.31084 type:complete len:560 (-) Transcript_12734:98-1777(-)|eukprot:CAMPEP_0181129644 /NCGR_PEP_ID=MMETSP1071-20121207/29432_1 /TAXON_ID=35127 /ORGANISM="Thalassiosira sp., Strain NH16" /LENGTH=559 /DNA_ID=CAMNT_0023215645 /DNA_START=886 /DNA_END=2565 /DNA_ORIENTATION=-